MSSVSVYLSFAWVDKLAVGVLALLLKVPALFAGFCVFLFLCLCLYKTVCFARLSYKAGSMIIDLI